jgi:hypothetical protein
MRARARDALHFLILTVAGWLSRRQVAAIAYLREENRVLRAQLGCTHSPERTLGQKSTHDRGNA